MKPSTALKLGVWRKTGMQALSIWLLSSLPLIFAAGYQSWIVRMDEESPSFWGFIAENLSTGEAFLYVAAFVAPFFWTIGNYNESKKQVPYFRFLIILSVITLVGSALLFAANRAAPSSDGAQIPYLGLALYLSGLIIWIRSMHDDRMLPDIVDPGSASRARAARIRDQLGEDA